MCNVNRFAEGPASCASNQDSDCDGLVGCADPDCVEAVSSNAEICDNNKDDDCNGDTDLSDSQCDVPEICGDGVDNDQDQTTADLDTTECLVPWDEVPGDGLDNDSDGQVDEDGNPCEGMCGRCDGKPVDLLTRSNYIGPHVDAAIDSPQGGRFSLTFERRWTLPRLFSDANEDPLKAPHRVLSSGWRHNHDVRLILERTTTLPDAAVVFDDGNRSVRLHKLGEGLYGRSPSDGEMLAERISSTTWMVTDSDGSEYLFVGSPNTDNHPIVKPGITEEHLRLAEFRPEGQDRFVHTYVYEAANLGSNFCIGMPGGCLEERGLLVAVYEKWSSSSGNVSGAGFFFNYDAAGRLAQIQEARDRLTTTTGTVLTNFTYDTFGRLVAASTCAGYPTDSQCNATSPRPGDILVSYTFPTTIDGVAVGVDAPVEKVLRYRMSSTGTVGAVVDEAFLYAAPPELLPVAPFRAAFHWSNGVELSAPEGVAKPNGRMTWVRNGVPLDIDFEMGHPVRRTRKYTAELVAARPRQASSLDPRASGGSRSTGVAGETMTFYLRDEHDRVIVEIDSLDAEETATINPGVLGSCNSYSISSGTILAARRRYYRDLGDSEPTIATFSKANASRTTVEFPIDQQAWLASSVLGSYRVPSGRIQCAPGAVRYNDLSLVAYGAPFAAGSFPSTGTSINGPLDMVPMVRHQTTINLADGLIYQAAETTLTAVDEYHRAVETTSYREIWKMSDPQPTLLSTIGGRTRNSYFGLTATDINARGRLLLNQTYRSPATAALPIPQYDVCPTSSFDEAATPNCTRSKLTEGVESYITSTRTRTVDTQGVRATTTSNGQQSDVVSSVADGATVGSRRVNGNQTKVSWELSTLPEKATRGLAPIETRLLDAVGVILSRQVTQYDLFGHPETIQHYGSDGTLKKTTSTPRDDRFETSLVASMSTGGRVLSYERDAFGNVEIEREKYGPDIRTTTTYNRLENGLLSSQTESVGSETYEVANYSYDSHLRVESFFQDDRKIVFSYGPDGSVSKEIHESVIGAVGPLEKTYSTQYQYGATGAQRLSTETLSHSTFKITSLESRYDALGRLAQVTSRNTNNPGAVVTANFYDAKPAGYAGTYASAVPGRSFTLTASTNQLGRLALTTHSAGLTLYEYDSLGRPVMIVEAPNASLPPTQCNQSCSCTVLGWCSAPYLDPETARIYSLTYDTLGNLATLRYPSGRKVAYAFGNDKRGPSTVSIWTDPNGVNTNNNIVSRVVRNFDGSIASWEWGNNATPGVWPRHQRSYDSDGRVTRVEDLKGDGTVMSQVAYAYENGELDSETYAGLLPSTIQVAVGPGTTAYGYAHDRLKTWTDPSGVANEINFVGPVGDLLSQQIAGIQHDYQYWSGEGLNRRTAVGTNVTEVDFNWFDSMSVSSVDVTLDGTREISSLVRGPRGDYESYSTTSVGAVTQLRDERMRRWSFNSGFIQRSFGYGPLPGIASLHEFAPGYGIVLDEYIYLDGMVVGATRSATSATTASWWLSPDRFGVPVRAMSRNTTPQNGRRLVMDPWGKGTEYVTTLGGVVPPRLPWRRPGQVADPESVLVDNGARSYLPDLGQYLQPDPLFSSSMSPSAKGPQAYAYANGNPLKYIDPDGLYADMWDAAAASTMEIKGRTGGWNVRQEHCTIIYKTECDGGCEWDYTPLLAGTLYSSSSGGGISYATCDGDQALLLVPRRSTAVAILHNHHGDLRPTGIAGTPRPEQQLPGDTDFGVRTNLDLFMVGRNPLLNLSTVNYHPQYRDFKLTKSFIAEFQ